MDTIRSVSYVVRCVLFLFFFLPYFAFRLEYFGCGIYAPTGKSRLHTVFSFSGRLTCEEHSPPRTPRFFAARAPGYPRAQAIGYPGSLYQTKTYHIILAFLKKLPWIAFTPRDTRNIIYSNEPGSYNESAV